MTGGVAQVEERIACSELDRYGRDRLRRDGERLLADAGETSAGAAAIVWALTREAARTIRGYTSPAPRGYPSRSLWPEWGDPNWFGVLRARLSDGIETRPEPPRLAPDAAAIDRAEVMWLLWRHHALPKLGRRRELIRHVWAYAAGVRPAQIRERTGITRHRLYRAKDAGCEVIARLLGW